MPSRPILVTGAGGFIGSHLVESLLDEGYQVRAFLRYTSHASVGGLVDVIQRSRASLEVVYGDLRVAADVMRAAEGCAWIFHLAALIGIPYSYESPSSYVDVNITGTLNVLEAARRLGIERTIITSTSEVYGSARYPMIDEEHPLCAQSPYAASKIGADQLAISYFRSFGLPVWIVRPFNTFGPRQSSRAVIPSICSQARFRGSIRLGSLTPIRDFVFVRDTAAGFLAVARSDSLIGQATNLATGRGVRIADIIDLVRRIVGAELPVELDEARIRPPASEVDCLIGSAVKANSQAAWSPQTTFEDGLAQTFRWIESHCSGNAEDYRR
ncbi:MAG: GDP-mannose 4,6-dehydratase [Planctomycetes bacterium]|nr:GDP-mannose 4,6-dehydratase [Planctomycetota bacterium]